MIRHKIAATSLLSTFVVFGVLQAAAEANANVPTWDPPRAVVSSAGRVRHVVRNPNDCAPFESRAVWGPGPATAAPLGYRCYHNPNGG